MSNELNAHLHGWFGGHGFQTGGKIYNIIAGCFSIATLYVEGTQIWNMGVGKTEIECVVKGGLIKRGNRNGREKKTHLNDWKFSQDWKYIE